MAQNRPIWIWQEEEWPAFHWDDTSLAETLREIHQLQGKLLGHTEAIADHSSLETQIDALLQNAIRTHEIEGEELDANSVRSSLAKRLGVEAAGLPPGTPQTDGVVDLLLDATRNFEEPLTEERLFRWHRGLFPKGSIIPIGVCVGTLRGEQPMQVVSGRIDQPTVHFEAPPRKVLQEELDHFLTWFKASRTDATLDPIIRAGLAHFWFVTLHPFDDGNGRLARAIADLALAQAEQQGIRFYAMAASIANQRTQYYNILEQCQRGPLDLTPWLTWFLKTLRTTLLSADEHICTVLTKSRFWAEHAQTILNERQIKMLNKLLDTGVDNFEGGMTARKYASMASVSKATATRELADLLVKNCLEKLPGGGRSTSYGVRRKVH